MKILSPKAAKELNLKSIPDFVFEAFNNLLIKNYDDYCVILHVKDVTEEIIKVCTIPGGILEDDIYKNGWLNVEYEYRRNGWDVEYERDGNFSKFIFKPKG